MKILEENLSKSHNMLEGGFVFAMKIAGTDKGVVRSN